jgi:hypothetical protein
LNLTINSIINRVTAEVRLLSTEFWWESPAGVMAVPILDLPESIPESPLMSTGFKQPRPAIHEKNHSKLFSKNYVFILIWTSFMSFICKWMTCYWLLNAYMFVMKCAIQIFDWSSNDGIIVKFQRQINIAAKFCLWSP